MNMPINHATQRRLRMEAAADWLGLAYRCLFTALVMTPLWGTALALAIAWNRMH
jgi:hypothetical protein